MHVRTVAAILVMLAACDSSDGRVTPDAPQLADAAPIDVEPFSCTAGMPVAPAGPACLALAPATLQGGTPFGDLDEALAYVGAGDCIDHATATVQWVGACQEQLVLQFPYPVTTDGARRRVVGSFDVTARMELRPVDQAPRSTTTKVHVDVTSWEEGNGVHTIDITVAFTDGAFTVLPVHIQGTFCDWPYYLC
jgi:hypothetical protein